MFSKVTYIFSVLFLGIFFSVLFYGPVMKIQRFYEKHFSVFHRQKGLFRVLAALSWYILMIAFVVLVIIIFYSNMYHYFRDVSWDEFMKKATGTLRSVIEIFPFLNQPKMKKRCMDLFFSAMDTGIEKGMEGFASMLMKLPKTIAKLVISMMISIYLFIDRDNYLTFFKRQKEEYLTGKQSQMLHHILNDAKEMFFGYWKGQSLDALLMGIGISIGLSLIGIPLGISIGILAGIGNLIPYLGPLIAYTFTIFFAVIEGKEKRLFLALVYLLVLQQLDGSYIGPRLLGKHMDLRPLTVMVAVFVGGTLCGTFGMMFAVPATGIIKSVVTILRKERTSYDKSSTKTGDFRDRTGV